MTLFSASRALCATFLLLHVLAEGAPLPHTERQYLSGHGPGDARPWEFSVSAGRRAGEWSTIPVPSQWEQHGFGTYHYGDTPALPDERGRYRLRFTVPAAWHDRRIRLVFEGAMTDASVKVNGISAGPTHVGGFYRFGYDITALLASGSNLLEVDVAKRSSNEKTAGAENQADYWMFGGLFRPVWLEAAPVQSISHAAIDARADGSLTAAIELAGEPAGAVVEARIIDARGMAVGAPFSAPVTADTRLTLRTRLPAPRLWTAETPNLYTLRLTLRRGAAVLHTSAERFGFRTFEVRQGDGLYLNGKRIVLKGVNRHSFRPDTGRALDRADNYADVRLIKEMNMNTVRMSHYPPDPDLLEAADELGLYVLDELSGWQKAHDTTVGRQLVREMVTRDVNHPSILFWDNGNEGGWNRDLDDQFALHDPQQRAVLHPWELHGGVDTKHYPSYSDLTRRLKGPHLVMPTEVLHGLYDGGSGAGLNDYWDAITSSPFGAGAILWVLADEGVARTDRAGRIDVAGTAAPDGLVGPRHEKEASYYTARQLWSPVQIVTPVLGRAFDGVLTLTNHYDFTSLAGCRFDWQLVRYPAPGARGEATVLASGRLRGPDIAPGASGRLDLKLPPGWQQRDADALRVVATGPDDNAVWTWAWPMPAMAARLDAAPSSDAMVRVEQGEGETRLIAGDTIATFDAGAILRSLRRGARQAALANGPRLVLTPAAPARAGTRATVGTGSDAHSAWMEAKGGDGLDKLRWTMHGDGTLQLDYGYRLDGKFLYHGITFDHPEADLKSVRWLGEGPYRSWQNRLHGTTLGVYGSDRNVAHPGQSWIYPEFQGYFAGLRWARFETTAGALTFSTPDEKRYLRIGTPDGGYPNTSPAFPAGDISFMHAIPAMGEKFLVPSDMGPSGQPATAKGEYAGRIYIRFDAP